MKNGLQGARVLLLQHAVYPYRRPVFDELARTVDLTVLFCVAAKAFRRWDTTAVLQGARFDARVLPHRRLGKLVVNPTFLRELRRGRFEVILFGPIDLITLPQVLVLIAFAKFRKIPLIVCEEFFPSQWYVGRRPLVARIAILVRQLVYRLCDGFVVWNPKAREFVLRSGARSDRVFFGPHYYPPPADFPGDSAPIAEPGKRAIVAISYLVPWKGIDILIAAFRRLPHDDAVLVIGGRGESEERLRAAAAGDERIRFVGHLDEAEKDRYLRNAYLFVLPSLRDVWGLVVNEALYRGLPVVVSDAAGCSDVLVRGNGFVVPAGDEAALSDRLRFLLDNPRERDVMASRSRSIVVDCSLRAMVDPVIAAVQSVR
jgi:glycosyltransferase involved in cell wall biosynthesis